MKGQAPAISHILRMRHAKRQSPGRGTDQ